MSAPNSDPNSDADILARCYALARRRARNPQQATENKTPTTVNPGGAPVTAVTKQPPQGQPTLDQR